MIDIAGMKAHVATVDAETRARCFKRASTLQHVGDKYVWHYKNHRLVVDPPDILGKYRAWCFTGEKVLDVPSCDNVWDAMMEIERRIDDE